MRVVPLALRRDPLDVLASLALEPGAFSVEVPDASRPLTLLGCAPRSELRVLADGAVERDGHRGSTATPLDAIEEFVAEGSGDEPFPLGAVVGYLAYELGRFTEPVGPPRIPQMPLAVLRRYDPMLVYDRRRAQYALACSDRGAARAPWLARLAEPTPTWDGPLASAPLAPRWRREQYLAAAARVLEYLVAGDAYQVNLTQPFSAPLPAPAWALFIRLTRCHPVPYATFLDLGATQLVANSPELFLRRRGRRVETEPIKGTRPRAVPATHDAALAADLLRDAKERAEHVMIVDLERNDLGRVCVPG
jgi:anthranilate/para-aminobenzoate synthase component I